MHQTRNGNEWYFGMKAHIGADAGTGFVHSVTATAANVHDLDEAVNLVRADDEVVYADAGYQGARSAPRSLATGASRRSGGGSRPQEAVEAMAGPGRAAQSQQASVRAKVEHPFLIVKRDFGFPRPATAGSRRTATTCTCCSLPRTG